MNTLEMSNEFDVLYNNIMSNLAPGIDEYEKSLFLTKAQDEILKAYFNPKGNKYIEGFDGSEKRQIDFSSLINISLLNLIQNPINQFDIRSKVYKMPDDCFMIVNEQVIDTDKNGDMIDCQYRVLPITYLQYMIKMSKPYKYPPKNVIWRLITSSPNIARSSLDSNNDNDNDNIIIHNKNVCQCEIIGRYSRRYTSNEGPIYKMRYLKRPNPIILVDLETYFNGLSIDGKYNVTDCQLDPILHHEIVLRAVELAAATYNPLMLNSLTGIGIASSTNIGVIPLTNSK